MAQNKTLLYDQVVEITEDYLGPAAKRFVDRQIANHLQKSSPIKLDDTELAELIDWMIISFAILTEDKALVQEFGARLNKLINNQVAA